MSYDDYYRDVYLPVHTKWWTRFCHLVGNVCTLGCLAAALWWISMGSWLGLVLLAATPFVIYPIAIPSHYLFEGSPPAVLGGKDSVPYQPLKAKYSDWRMCFEWLTGKL